ncbi:hypothetical protein PC114_g13416 [Phytophthora cactorum]|nr:hypothetical protein PC114_g13416 [Phytophthora cactorum]
MIAAHCPVDQVRLGRGCLGDRVGGRDAIANPKQDDRDCQYKAEKAQTSPNDHPGAFGVNCRVMMPASIPACT